MSPITYMRAATALLFCALAQLTGSAQSSAVPPPGDPEVFLIFLRFHDRLSTDLTQQRAANAAEAARIEARWQAKLNAGSADLRQLSAAYGVLKQQIAALDTEANAHVAAAARANSNPDIAVLKNIEERRLQAILNTVSSIRQNLTAAGWQGVTQFINGEFRKSITRSPLK